MGFRVSVVVVSFMAVLCGAGSGVLAQERVGAHTRAVEVAPDDVVQELRLEDGSRLYGRVAEVEGDRVVFRTVSGLQLVLTRDQISDVRRVRGHLHEGEFRLEANTSVSSFPLSTARSASERRRAYL